MNIKTKGEREKLQKLILRSAKKGKVILKTFEGLVMVDLEEIVRQPTEGLLYDLNRDKATVLAFISDVKWINDFAVALVIEKLKACLDEATIELTELKERAEESPWGGMCKEGKHIETIARLRATLDKARIGMERIADGNEVHVRVDRLIAAAWLEEHKEIL
ncbi:MAG: hypothetical protein Q8M94_01555 [Ignavibacteria bacterium]|nr:hypothetical protein [Ignavibacteria bacterium]